MAWAAADRVEAVMKAAARATEKKRLEDVDARLLFKEPELTRQERITMNPPTAVLLPDFRELPPHAVDRAERRQSGTTGYRRTG